MKNIIIIIFNFIPHSFTRPKLFQISMVKCLQDFSTFLIALATRSRQFSAVENNTRKQYFLFRLFKNFNSKMHIFLLNLRRYFNILFRYIVLYKSCPCKFEICLKYLCLSLLVQTFLISHLTIFT